MKYAENTEVSVAKSRAEIETIISRYGATGFLSGWRGDLAMIEFELKHCRIRFMLPLPDRNAQEFTHGKLGNSHTATRLPPDKAAARWEQACRQRWRALALAIKAKLEAVECEISTFEQEFMAQLVLPNGLTLGETVMPKLPEIMAGRPLPPLLPDYGNTK